MDFRPTEDQEALRDGIRAWCDGSLPFERLGALAREGGFDRDLWRGAAEMGVFSLRLEESQGGVGLGLADAVLVFAELGRRLVPGPLVWTHLAAGLVDGAASGGAIVGGLDLMGAWGQPYVIESGGVLDALLVLRPDGVERLDPRALKAEPVATPLDPLTPLTVVHELPRGQRLGDAGLAARLRREGAALVAAQCLGVAEMTQELATAYAKQREQFNRAIAGFQSIKHMLADMWVRQEMARAAVWAAGATCDHAGEEAPGGARPGAGVGDPGRAVASAKVVAGEAAMKNARTCIQVHGGMGYTWEMPPHYYLKRAWVLGTQFGDAEEHAEALAESIGAA
jgi:alkylation response protein AidB-like acyl-CoA dehydrogenase